MLQGHLTQLFMKAGGYQTLGPLVDKLQQYPEVVPFQFLQSFTSLLSAVYVGLGNEEKEGLIEKMMEVGDNNLGRIGEGQIKELNKYYVSNFFSALVGFAAHSKF